MKCRPSSRGTPPDIWAEINISAANEILDRIERGPSEEQRYSAEKQAATTDRAAWRVVQNGHPHLSEKQCKAVIAEWIKSGMIETREYHDAAQRKSRMGLFVAKRPG